MCCVISCALFYVLNTDIFHLNNHRSLFSQLLPRTVFSDFNNNREYRNLIIRYMRLKLFIVTRTAIVMSQWYDRYCFTEYARTWARLPTTPWQRECTAITDRQSIDSLLDPMRFVTNFLEIAPFILRDAIVVLVQSQCYLIQARAFGPRTLYRVGGLAGDVMRAWVSHSLVNHWIYIFKASLWSC